MNTRKILLFLLALALCFSIAVAEIYYDASSNRLRSDTELYIPSSVESDILIAHDIIQKTKLYKDIIKDDKKALSLIKNSSEYYTNGEINHSLHYAYDNKTDGLSIPTQTAVCEQAIYEIKVCVNNSKNFDEYKACIGGV